MLSRNSETTIIFCRDCNGRDADCLKAALAGDKVRAARQRGFQIMVGCMIGTSLSMAPAMLVAQRASVVDLDGPLLLASDRAHGLRYDGSTLYPAEPVLWG